MPLPLYIFDMDDTLIDGDCSMLWNEFLVAKGYVTIANFLETDRRLMGLYAIGEMDMEDYLDYVMQPLATLSCAQVDALVDDFIDEYVTPRVFRQAQSLIDQLKQQGHTLLVISATVSFIVKKVALSLGITEAIGIDMQVANGGYSAKIDGVPSYREGKISRLEDWLAHAKQPYAPLHFYLTFQLAVPTTDYYYCYCYYYY